MGKEEVLRQSLVNKLIVHLINSPSLFYIEGELPVQEDEHILSVNCKGEDGKASLIPLKLLTVISKR